MNIGIRIGIDLFLLIGCFFAFAGVVGMLRMPDVFCRMQSSTNIATLGLLGVLAACLIYSIYKGMEISTVVKLALVGLLVIGTNPVAGHAICKGAYKHGDRPDKPMVCDDYGRDESDED
jgi:multicomponent Na+:H+ antiporter subunit G